MPRFEQARQAHARFVTTARFRAVGIDQAAYRSDLITGDKIAYFSPTLLPTPEQVAKVRAAGPPSGGLPATGGEVSTAPVAWLLALAGLMLMIGLALQHARVRTR